ncbi:hypothetical protein ACTXT7_007150 [Hymenolepis weldensis]
MFRRNKKHDFVEENSKRKFLSQRELAKKLKHLKLLIVDLVNDLLSPVNPIDVQVIGMRIFILWYQILGENVIPECTDVFIHLVPDVGQLHDSLKARNSKTGNQTTVVSDANAHRGLRDVLYHHRADPITSITASPQSKDELCHDVYRCYSDKNCGLACLNCTSSSVKYSRVESDLHANGMEKNFALLRYLLRFSVTEVDKIQWTNTTFDKRHMCFWFLFEQLKRYYFPVIFPKISAKYSIYDDGLLPSIMSNPSGYSPIPDAFTLSVDRILIYQEETVRWLTDFLYTGPRALMTRMCSISSTSDLRNLMGNEPGSVKNPHSSEGSTSGIDMSSQSEIQRSSVGGQDRRTIVPVAADSPVSASFVEPSILQQNPQASSNLPSVQRQQCRNSAAFTNILPIMEIRQTVPGYFAEHVVLAPARSTLLEPVLPNIPEFCLEYSPRMVSRVRDILFNSRANVNCIHAVLYHASLLPLDRYKALLCLVLVYRTWMVGETDREKPTSPHSQVRLANDFQVRGGKAFLIEN